MDQARKQRILEKLAMEPSSMSAGGLMNPDGPGYPATTNDPGYRVFKHVMDRVLPESMKPPAPTKTDAFRPVNQTVSAAQRFLKNRSGQPGRAYAGSK